MKRAFLTLSVIGNILLVVFTIRHFLLIPRPLKNQKLTFFVHRDKILSSLPTDSTDIVFFGDSQIQNFELVEYFKSTRFKNRGIYYDTSKGLLYRSNQLAAGSPAAIVIEIGINDLENNVPIDTIKKNIELTIKLIKKISPTTKINLLSVIPTDLKFGNPARSIESERLQLNKAYADLAVKNKLKYIDLDPFFLKDGLNKKYDVGDNLHLNHSGYLKLTDILKPIILDNY